MKICSILGCAPQLKKSFGFDILVYDDSAVFCMEKCHPLNDVNNDIVQQLKEHLRTMHLFHIIHYDIKPDNIMLSPYSGKPVFIDFGFSDIVKE
jgi:serine/threonine protein kinase